MSELREPAAKRIAHAIGKSVEFGVGLYDRYPNDVNSAIAASTELGEDFDTEVVRVANAVVWAFRYEAQQMERERRSAAAETYTRETA